MQDCRCTGETDYINNGKILHLLRDFVQVDAESGLVIPDGQDLRSISLRRPTLTEVALEPCCQGSGQTGICVGSGGLSRHLSKVQNCN